MKIRTSCFVRFLPSCAEL